jgi:hypothetical protein
MGERRAKSTHPPREDRRGHERGDDRVDLRLETGDRTEQRAERDEELEVPLSELAAKNGESTATT